jgi:hypothetical protein
VYVCTLWCTVCMHALQLHALLPARTRVVWEGWTGCCLHALCRGQFLAKTLRSWCHQRAPRLFPERSVSNVASGSNSSYINNATVTSLVSECVASSGRPPMVRPGRMHMWGIVLHGAYPVLHGDHCVA